MKPLWPQLAAMGLNTVVTPLSWELIEPTEGNYDFTLVDGLACPGAPSPRARSSSSGSHLEKRHVKLCPSLGQAGYEALSARGS